MRSMFRRAVIALAVILPVWSVARGAELADVPVPDTQQVDGKTLQLNGYGLRTYSFLHVRIYVTALYLEQLSTNADAILRSPETKLLTVTFLRDITVDQARKSWRDGLANNCLAPCRLDPVDLASFLAVVPAMHSGDRFWLRFTPQGATVTVNGQPIGTVSHPAFATAMLATFLGPNPASPALKHDLLAGGAKR